MNCFFSGDIFNLETAPASFPSGAIRFASRTMARMKTLVSACSSGDTVFAKGN